MARAVLPATLALAAVSVMSGCGTMIGNLGGLSLDHYYEVYGGVRVDLDFCRTGLKELWNPSEGNTRGGALLGEAAFAVDLPLSFVADTLTLPFTIKATLNGEARHPEGLVKPPSDTPQVAQEIQPGDTPVVAAKP
jgi:uncharacterized protein YceK